MTRPYFLVYGSDLFANEKRMELGLLDRGALTTLWVYGSVKGDEAHRRTLGDVVSLVSAPGFAFADIIVGGLVEKGGLDTAEDGVRIHDWGVWQPAPPKSGSQRHREWRDRVGVPRDDVFMRDEYRCRYCANPITPATAVLEHVIPYGRPGCHEPENLVTACRTCNRKKGSRTPAETGMPLLPIPVSGDPGPSPRAQQ